jgi:hypothetical protein
MRSLSKYCSRGGNNCLERASIPAALDALIDAPGLELHAEAALEVAPWPFKHEGAPDLADCQHVGMTSATRKGPLRSFDQRAVRLDGVRPPIWEGVNRWRTIEVGAMHRPIRSRMALFSRRVPNGGQAVDGSSSRPDGRVTPARAIPPLDPHLVY